MLKTTNNKITPYARHIKRDICGLADFDEEKFALCPFINNENINDLSHKKSDISPEIKKQILLLKNNFDKVIHLIGQETGIYFGISLQTEMLKYFVNDEIYLYCYLDITNLPWLFNHCFSYSMFGIHVKDDSELANAMRKDKNITTAPALFYKNEPHKGYICQAPSPKQFIRLKFSFGEYAIKNEGDDEYVMFRVSYVKDGSYTPVNIYTKKMKIDPIRWQNLLKYKNWIPNNKQLEIAANILSKLLK